ncbi:D-arabinono-1,4-lactone oxidase [Microlunatus ginsengisoli]|uniref:D-arabinono-1,4-lactone oxidase n=1 Tax=Microlunatus ginsengisoli TaxID=363863 RepID=A0ABP7A0J3_9ACTN
MSDPRWRNWAGNQRCEPSDTVHPATVDELAATITAAAQRGLHVKPVGAGHSFTPIALTDGIQLDLDRLTGITAVVPESGRGTTLVTVRGGTRLAELNATLATLGLALENLGDIDRQTITGALATGTHGTGARLGGLATQVAALTLVTADGSVLRCDAEQHPDVFAAARVGIGALGVVSDVTLRCVPAFRLRAIERPGRLAETLESFPETVQAHDHAEFYWFPHTDRVLTKVNDRAEDGRPLNRLRFLLDDEVLSNGLFRVVNEIGRLRPSAIPTINQVSARALSARTYTAPSYQVFTSPRRVRFSESEYAVPRAALPDVIGALRGWLDGHDETVAFPVEVRVAAADDIWLSTGFERENAYVAVHQFNKRPDQRYFAAFESIVAEHAGRPHWGKLHTLDAARLAALYPRHADFVAVRDRLDPGRTFDNGYLRRVLG